MIDPKLNKLPVGVADDLEDVPESDLTDEQRAARSRRARAGLSVKDTIAGDAALSVGSRGVDTSGVKSGAGAGSGMTSVTPGQAGESPAPNIVPGARSSGTTPRGSSSPDQNPNVRLDEGTGPNDDEIGAHEIAARAYSCWHERGCPHGSPEVDWSRAEEELRQERRRNRSTAASA